MKPKIRTQTPTRLADFDGLRRPGNKINMIAGGKAPKRRFNIGDSFHYEGGIWNLIYMYRIKDNPNEWRHMLEETRSEKDLSEILSNAFEALGAGATTPRIVYDLFYNSSDAMSYFNDIYRNGDGKTFTTKELLKLKKV